MTLPTTQTWRHEAIRTSRRSWWWVGTMSRDGITLHDSGSHATPGHASPEDPSSTIVEMTDSARVRRT
jgi:hypothetical protein